MAMPSLFLSHGAPTLPFTDTPARAFLHQLGGTLERPKAILVVSAHWETNVPTVSAVDRNETMHDFGGFPRALYELRYPAPGSPTLAGRVSTLLQGTGLDCKIDRSRGLDHGAWVPLLLMYPQSDVPVLQLSIQTHLGPAHHLRVGRALAPLRDEGVLIVGSGSFTHDLSEFRGHGPNDPAPHWVNGFRRLGRCGADEWADRRSARLSASGALRDQEPSDRRASFATVRGAGGGGRERPSRTAARKRDLPRPADGRLCLQGPQRIRAQRKSGSRPRGRRARSSTSLTSCRQWRR